MTKKVRQGQTRWLLDYYPPYYTKSGCWEFYAHQAFVTKTEVVVSGVTGEPFNHLHVHLREVGHYFWGEKGFLQRTYKNKGACIKKAKRIVSYINWMYDNGHTDEDVKVWLESVIKDKEK